MPENSTPTEFQSDLEPYRLDESDVSDGVLWTGLDGASTQIEARDIAHTIIDEHTVSVTFEVSLPVNRTASCAVQALNESYSVVGWKIIDLPPSTLYNRSFTQILRTTDLSNTGLIYQCWLT